VTAAELTNPILNSPYSAPEEHFELGPDGPTGTVLPGRRPSESFIPVPAVRKGRGKGAQAELAVQTTLDFDLTGERREQNSLINDIRRQVELWRARNYPGVTPMSRKLLVHWAGTEHDREDRMLFCQREAAETAIYLAEVAGRERGERDFRSRVDEQNALHNDGLPRTALKMATGTGKTVVMAMLIAWQTINKVASPRDARFSKRFLVITPGITIRDRLRVLQPSADENYYLERDLVPQELWPMLLEAQVVITNYHAFLLKDAPEIKGVAANTRKILNRGKDLDPFKETEDDMVSRVLRDFAGRAGRGSQAQKGKKGANPAGEIVVLNDEAHHCYMDKPIEAGGVDDDVDKEARERNADARVWFKGIRAIARKVGVKAVYDLSATPFYLKGSGYNEGFIFPWTVSDFSLMDAIESGIVKVPRLPVDDDAAGDDLTFRTLWEHIGKKMPKALSKALRAEMELGTWVPPKELEGALESLHRSYRRRFEQWEQTLAKHGEPPPVMIVVCPNTTASKLVYDWIAGVDVPQPDDTTRPKPGNLPLLTNVVDGEWLPRPRTILVDSAALESGEALKADFKKAVEGEIEAFKAEIRRRDPGADLDKVTDEDILREVMNTVGKKGKLGEHVRCVVSVSMLTEGWDANTVSHILGIRAFGSQLLCEQVVGRGLRRRSYVPDPETDRFEPEYAEVYGVPFAFISGEPEGGTEKPKMPAVEVRALDERAELEIRFPRLEGYRVELPDDWHFGDFGDDAAFRVERDTLPVWVDVAGIVGANEEIDLEEYRNARPQHVAYKLAAELVQKFYVGLGDDPKPWLFPRLVELAKRWLAECVTYDDDAFVGLLLPAQNRHAAAEHLFGVLVNVENARREVLLPRFARFSPEGTTADVSFLTRKVVIPATKSHVSHVVLDGEKGNTWEENVSDILEGHGQVASYVKNDRLGFTVPYVHEGRSHEYVPDFLVRLTPQGDGIERTLIIEVSGGRKDQKLRELKAQTTRDQWCVAVNNHGGWGRWAFLEISDMTFAAKQINQALDALATSVPSTDAPILGATA
jgi:type III restriction enzyme